MSEVVGAARRDAAPAEATRIVLRPRAVDEAGFTVTAEGEAFRVRGEKPERWVRQTDFSNDEAVGYLADRLARLGVEQALVEAGASAGAEVRIGPGDNAVVFDWEPTLQAGAELLHGPRGGDIRVSGDGGRRRHGRSGSSEDDAELDEVARADVDHT
jgi:GTP-binding protein